MHLTCFMFFDHIKAKAVVTCLASQCAKKVMSDSPGASGFCDRASEFCA